jgi:hypothetical protein
LLFVSVQWATIQLARHPQEGLPGKQMLAFVAALVAAWHGLSLPTSGQPNSHGIHSLIISCAAAQNTHRVQSSNSIATMVKP